MSVAWTRASFRRLTAAIATVVLAAATGGCSPAPQPPVQPVSPDSGYRTMLEQFSKRLLDDGAPAVLVQIRVGGDV